MVQHSQAVVPQACVTRRSWMVARDNDKAHRCSNQALLLVTTHCKRHKLPCRPTRTRGRSTSFSGPPSALSLCAWLPVSGPPLCPLAGLALRMLWRFCSTRSNYGRCPLWGRSWSRGQRPRSLRLASELQLIPLRCLALPGPACQSQVLAVCMCDTNCCPAGGWPT